MRPVIKVIATRIEESKIYVQFMSDPEGWTRMNGALSMTMDQYRPFINTLTTGSLASGTAGSEIRLIEHDFDKWGKEKQHDIRSEES